MFDGLWYDLLQSQDDIDINPDREVGIAEDGMVFHSPKQLKSHMGVDMTTMDEAVEDGCLPCSRCFVLLSSFQQTVDSKSIQRL